MFLFNIVLKYYWLTILWFSATQQSDSVTHIFFCSFSFALWFIIGYCYPLLSFFILCLRQVNKILSEHTELWAMKLNLDKGLYRYIYNFFLTWAKAMATHSSSLAWKIPWAEEPGWLQSMGLLRVGHDWATSLSVFTFRHWRRKWQPTPVFLCGESQGWGSLVGCRLWGRTELDTTEAT